MLDVVDDAVSDGGVEVVSERFDVQFFSPFPEGNEDILEDFLAVLDILEVFSEEGIESRSIAAIYGFKSGGFPSYQEGDKLFIAKMKVGCTDIFWHSSHCFSLYSLSALFCRAIVISRAAKKIWREAHAYRSLGPRRPYPR